MAGLDPAICLPSPRDARLKAGHDDFEKDIPPQPITL
jgi:hypothetical protein